MFSHIMLLLEHAEVKYTIIHTAPSVYYYRTYNDSVKTPKMA